MRIVKSRNDKVRRWRRRRAAVRKSIERGDRAQLMVFRSARHIYAQLVDVETGRTITSISTRSKAVVPDGATGNVEAAKKVGTAIAKAALDKQIDKVVFNRNGFLYHGRIKALADAAREAGLQF